jgi:hypothetical protein
LSADAIASGEFGLGTELNASFSRCRATTIGEHSTLVLLRSRLMRVYHFEPADL